MGEVAAVFVYTTGMAKNSNKKKKNRPGHAVARVMPYALSVGLNDADDLIERRQWDGARMLLAELDRRYPNQHDVLALQVNLAFDQKDMQSYQNAAERLLKLTPKDADLTLGLAGAYMSNRHMVLALRTFRRFLEHWPNHARAAETRETAAELEQTLRSVLPQYGLEGEDAFALVAQHEEVKSLIDQNQWARARLRAEQTLRRKPDFVPVLNNLSLAYFNEGQSGQAIAPARRVLDLDADNYHALGNLVRYSCLSGRLDEANAWGERLKSATAPGHLDIWTKKAESLSFLGDDQGVLDAFHAAERDGKPYVWPLLCHLAAVAALRQGREDEARRQWRRALELAPWLHVARDNLEDLDMPIGERHAPWPFGLSEWLSHRDLEEFARKSLSAAARHDPRALAEAQQRFLRQHPALVRLIPLLLDRGDPKGRDFALHVALESRAPELAPALRDFALSQRGPDIARSQAAEVAQLVGLLPDGPLRLWTHGSWRDIEVMGFEIHGEPSDKHGPRVEKLQLDATLAIRKGDTARGERLIRQALEVEPDAPDLWNNLAAAYAQDGRVQDAEEIVRQIHARDPDYLFGRTNLALQHIRADRLDEAEALLKPLRARKRIHVSEFSALMDAQIRLCVARKELDAARGWFDLWARTKPDAPAFAHWQRWLAPGASPLARAGRSPR